MNHPTDASVLSALSLAGVRAKLLSPGSPCGEYSGCWYIDNAGACAILSWDHRRGFWYSAKFGKRWKCYARGRRLSTVLRVIARDVQDEKLRLDHGREAIATEERARRYSEV